MIENEGIVSEIVRLEKEAKQGRIAQDRYVKLVQEVENTIERLKALLSERSLIQTRAPMGSMKVKIKELVEHFYQLLQKDDGTQISTDDIEREMRARGIEMSDPNFPHKVRNELSKMDFIASRRDGMRKILYYDPNHINRRG